MSSYIKSGLCFAFTALQANTDVGLTQLLGHGKQHQHDVGVVKASASRPASPRASCGGENVVPAYSRSEVSYHCDSDSCWIVVNNKVYDVTRFLREHPGGEDIILEHAGHDATAAFMEKGHSRHAHALLHDYFIGEIMQADWLPEIDST